MFQVVAVIILLIIETVFGNVMIKMGMESLVIFIYVP